MPLEPGQKLSHYRLVEKIGEGGMGVVWKARDEKLRRDVALKVLPAELVEDPERRRRLLREARSAAAINHPNIATVHEVDEADGTVFIAMELVEGKTLRALLSGKPLAIPEALRIATEMAEGLAAAHETSIIHRDLKPENVLVRPDGHVKILDFGLAKIHEEREVFPSQLSQAETVTEEMTREGRILGTPAHMSPEQARGGAVDARSDIFSFGTTLYEMVTGRAPFKGGTLLDTLSAILNEPALPPSQLNADVPAQLEQILAKCLEKDPGQRYQNTDDLVVDLRKLRESTLPRPGRRRMLWAAGALVVTLAAIFITWNMRRNARIQWARTEAIPHIQELREKGSWVEWGLHAWEGHELASEAARYIGDDPTLAAAWNIVAREIVIKSNPPGADVWAKAYIDPDGEWRHVGRTPLEPVRFPHGLSRIKLELAGHRTKYDLLLNQQSEWIYRLQPEGSLPEEMVFVPSGEFDLFLPGIDHLKTEATRDFLMDRYEVTNREYKRFVDAGGYENPDFWPASFAKDGQELTWEEAMAKFRDSTDRPGPVTWEVGDYLDGLVDHPVAGVSWYEATAYARWAGKSLSTVFHWNQVALTWASGEIVPLSNFAGAGASPVGHYKGMHRHGVFDLAGNVREWTRNATARDDGRFILGGGWNDPGYAFNDAYAQSPWDRSPTNGFRCIRYLDPEGETEALARKIEMPFRDFYNEEPASDETFAIWLKQYDYDPTPLEATLDAEKDDEDWVHQTISFNAAYGSERMMAYLFLPKMGTRPFPTVVYFPGSNAIHTGSSTHVTGRGFDFLLKSGRAVMFPIYKGTYERGDELDSDYPEETNFYKEHVIMWAKDLSRSIDYLETREDLDTSRLAFYGFSWGGTMGAILPAIEERIKVNVLYVAGLLFQRALPEVDQINYVSRVRQPTLMVNGEFDFFFPVKTSQKPLYDLLGTPEQHKRYVVFPGSHSVPRTELIKEVLTWLDRY